MNIVEIQNFFFDAMLHGWAAGVEARLVPNMPRYQEIPYQRGDFSMVDRWCSGSGGKFSGTKTIDYQSVPVWQMHYAGWYEEGVISFLKFVLFDTYQGSKFLGGRGTYALIDRGKHLAYANQPEPRSSFLEFSGQEFIRHTKGTTVETKQKGECRYFGMSLI